MTHRALIYRNYGKPLEVLDLVDETLPALTGTRDVRIQVRAFSLNPADLRMCEGQMKALVTQVMPSHIGFDISGVVDEVGSEAAKSFAKGDEVFGMAKGMRLGAAAQFCVMDVDLLCKKPQNLSFVQAAAVPLAALTAFQGLKETGLKVYSLNDSEQAEDISIAMNTGAGGVGTFAIQMAKHIFRASKIVATGSETRGDLLSKLGATEVVNYQKESLSEYLESNKKQMDTILDGQKEVLTLFPFVKPGGRLVSIADAPAQKSMEKWLNDMDPRVASVPGMIRNFIIHMPYTAEWVFGTRSIRQHGHVYGVEYGNIITSSNRDDLDFISQFLIADKIMPVIDSVHTLDNWRVAIERLQSGHATGKVVINVSE